MLTFFPDNVLTVDDQVTGLIDFYFACTDFRIYDLAVTHSAWAYDADGVQYHEETGTALLRGYAEVLTPTEAHQDTAHFGTRSGAAFSSDPAI